MPIAVLTEPGLNSATACATMRRRSFSMPKRARCQTMAFELVWSLINCSAALAQPSSISFWASHSALTWAVVSVPLLKCSASSA